MNKSLLLKLVLLFIAFSIFTFGHDYFGRTLAAEWDINDRVQFNQRFNTIALILSPLFIMPFLWGVFKERENWHIKLGYLIFTFSMAWFSYKNLLVVNSEMVHFPQYALLALLIFPILKNIPETLFATIFLGILDEGYQYFVLAPEKTAYMDFNDIWLNTIGAGFGVLLTGVIFPGILNPKSKYFTPHGLIPKGLILLAFIFGLMYFSEFLGYTVERNPNAIYYIFKEYPTNYWTEADFDVKYHIVRPLEGLLAVFMFCWIFHPAEKYFGQAVSKI